MSLSGSFIRSAASASPPPKRVRPAPFSIRLSEDERARLIAEARGASLGAYVKARLFDHPLPAPRPRRRSVRPVRDEAALAQVLALLGRSHIAGNLNQLAKLAHIGALPIDPQTEAELTEAVRAVRDLRRLLLRALGLKAEDERP